jgi:hypothetical protein
MHTLEWELRLVEALLTGQDPMLEALRNQCAVAEVRSRKYTGVGFYTQFTVADTAPRVEPPDFEITDVHADIVGLEAGAMAMLFVRQGVIDFLEVCAYFGGFPRDPEIRSVDYNACGLGSQSIRDMDRVRSFWTT